MHAAALQYVAGLNRSFEVVYALLERPKAARRAVVGLLAVHAALLAYSAYVHSPTLNEPGHLVAGLSHWKFGQFKLYRNNPPLVRMVAALPVMAVGYEEDWSGFYDRPGAMPQFAMGDDFVAANGERSFFLFMIARWACIPFSWIGAVVCYLWARDLYGRPAGVLACSIWCFEPNILAHASLITPDAHATALGLAACYTFWRWLKQPTWSQAVLTGIVLGGAELAKTTLILFYPLWPLMWVVYRLLERRSMAASQWLREAGMLAVRMAIGLYVLNLGYGFEGSLKPLGEFHFKSDLLTGNERGTTGEVHAAETQEGSMSAAPSSNRFADSRLPVPVPANYLLGIDVQRRDFERWSRPAYLKGEWREGGWWYYYLYAAAIKVPLGLWLLGAFALCLRLRWSSPAAFRDEMILLVPPLVVFVVVSSQRGINEHLRYVLPSFPFAFVWMASFLLGILGSSQKKLDARISTVIGSEKLGRRRLNWFATPACLILLSWTAASSGWIYPHSLSYFNEAIGGPLNGPNHLMGSNVDWGQDLRYVAAWIDHRQIYAKNYDIVIAYWGGFDPRVAISMPNLLSCNSLGDANAFSISWAGKANAHAPVLFCASTNFLCGGPMVMPAARATNEFVKQWRRSGDSSNPNIARCGYTWTIFDTEIHGHPTNECIVCRAVDEP